MDNEKDKEKDEKLPKLTEELQHKFDNLLFEFGRNMNTGRKKYRISQHEMALALGLSEKGGQVIVSRIETGKNNITIPTMMRIADVFDMEIQIKVVPKKKSESAIKSTGKNENGEDRNFKKETYLTSSA